MRYIALSGGPYCGKTTLAQELVKRGYMHIVFSDLLKQMAVYCLDEADVVSSVGDMHTNKPKYRTFLQGLAELTGFNTNPHRWVVEALQSWEYHMRPLAVFDNVRTMQQWEVLKEYGFELVNLSVPYGIQKNRAVRSGVSYEQFEKLIQHPLEQGFPRADVIQTSGEHAPVVLAQMLINL